MKMARLNYIYIASLSDLFRLPGSMYIRECFLKGDSPVLIS